MNGVTKTTLKSAKQVSIWQIQGQETGPSLLITAGIHGGENTPVQVAFELIEYFSRAPDFRGLVSIIPVVNIDGYARQVRENPTDGKNINAAGSYKGAKPRNYSQSDAIADEIIALAKDHDYFLDLHSASKGRYLSHVYYHDQQNSHHRELARVFGFYFVVYHNATKNDLGGGCQKTIPISTRVAKTDTTALTLELGAGVMVRRKDVKMALDGIISFGRQIGMLKGEVVVKKTSLSQVFTRGRNQITTVVKASQAGNIYFKKSLGETVKKGEVVAFIVNPQKRVLDIRSPVGGRLVLKRVVSKIEPHEVGKETVFRIMPTQA